MLDALDQTILSEIAQNARVRLEDLAHRSGVSRQTVAARVRRLEREGVITGYRAKLDLAKLGYRLFFALFLKLGLLDDALSNRFLEEVRKSPHVLLDCSVTGEWDVLLLLAFRDAEEYDAYQKELRKRYGRLFRDTKSHAILKIFKRFDDHSPF